VVAGVWLDFWWVHLWYSVIRVEGNGRRGSVLNEAETGGSAWKVLNTRIVLEHRPRYNTLLTSFSRGNDHFMSLRH